MSRYTNFWYLRGLGLFTKAKATNEGSYISPMVYDQIRKKWRIDQEGHLANCLREPNDRIYTVPVEGGKEIHAFEQIDYIARVFAADAYGNQTDEDGYPILEHLDAVAGQLNTQVERAAAYLHSVVEETDTKLEDIELGFGPEIAGIVDLLTYKEGDDYIEEYLWFIADDPIAVKVKLADLWDSIDKERRHPGEGNKERLRKYEGGVVFLQTYSEMKEDMDQNW